ncbi:hypothetical protein BDZ45DRAFT_782584 [Acephala macrosclerotiorum]|nr:hypothetical protein BDZ45DRAFT_782584 [Acephala macrosclerotiorum]
MAFDGENGTAIIIMKKTPVTFMGLPSELRLQIWSETIEPRMVHVVHKWKEAEPLRPMVLRDGQWMEHPDQKPQMLKLGPTTRTPVALRINGESRYHLLKQYKLLFNDNMNCQILFNYSIDTLYLGASLSECAKILSQQLWNNFSAGVRTLAIESTLIWTIGGWSCFGDQHYGDVHIWPFQHFEDTGPKRLFNLPMHAPPFSRDTCTTENR